MGEGDDLDDEVEILEKKISDSGMPNVWVKEKRNYKKKKKVKETYGWKFFCS
jgi:hypothetical protein